MNKIVSQSVNEAVHGEATVAYPLDKLELHPFNPRQEVSKEEIILLAKSIDACGLIQPLAGLKLPTNRIGIVAGGRRLRALQRLANEKQWAGDVPVRLAADETQARAWAVAENTARADLDPADEIAAYGAMKKAKSTVLDISAAFAVTETHVRRRLKLASLPKAVLNALKAKTIGITAAEAFTICNDKARIADAIKAVENGEIANVSALRHFLQPHSVSATDRRAMFVGIEAYEQAGGITTCDLFSEEVFLENPELLERLFAERLEIEAKALKSSGWHWVDCFEGSHLPWDYMEVEKLARIYPVEGAHSADEAVEYEGLLENSHADDLPDEGSARLNELQAILNGDYSAEQKTFAGAVLHVDYDGQLCTALGLVAHKDKPSAIERGLLAKPVATGVDKANGTYSKALQADIDRIRLAAIQTALLAKPDLVLDLLAFALSPASGDFATILDLGIGKPSNKPSKADGMVFDQRLEHRPDTYSEDAIAVEDIAAAFEEFQGQGKKIRNRAITEGLARTLPFSNGAFMAMLNEQTGADLRSIWAPNAVNFFKRVNGDALTKTYAQIIGLKPSAARVKSFATMKKAEKVATLEAMFNDPDRQKHLDAEQLARIKSWQPDDLH